MGDDGGVVGGADGVDAGRAGRRQNEAECEKPRHRGFLLRDDAKLGRVVYRFDLPMRGRSATRKGEVSVELSPRYGGIAAASDRGERVRIELSDGESPD